jgi:hypothetical protein
LGWEEGLEKGKMNDDVMERDPELCIKWRSNQYDDNSELCKKLDSFVDDLEHLVTR